MRLGAFSGVAIDDLYLFVSSLVSMSKQHLGPRALGPDGAHEPNPQATEL